MRSPSPASAFLALFVGLALLLPASADAAIYYRASTTSETVNGATTVVLSPPAGTAVGDFLVVDVDASGAAATTPPAGWTTLVAGSAGTYYGMLQYRVATAADVGGASSYTWNLGTSRKAVGRILGYVGVDTTAVGTAAATGGSGTTITFNSVTTAAANSLVILAGGTLNAAGTATLTPPAATTTRVNLGTSGAGSQMRSYSGDFIQAAAGATGNKTGTIAPTNSWGSAMFAVRPATGVLAFEIAPDAINLPGVTLNGQAQTTTAQMSNFTVDDTTGSGSGWNVTVAGDATGGKSAVLKQYCTQAGGCGADPFGYVASGFTLPAASLKLSSTGASFTGANGTAPTFQCGSPCSVDAAAATKIASAAAGAGLGPWASTGLGASSLSLSTPSTLRALPANEVYRVDLLWTLNSGP